MTGQCLRRSPERRKKVSRQKKRKKTGKEVLARTTPLFNNPKIQDLGKPLKAERRKKFMSVGIRRLCDLIFFDHIGSYEEITAYYGSVPRKAFDTLLAALPQDLVDRACLTQPLTMKSRWAINNGTSHTVVVIAEPQPDQVHQLPDLPWAYMDGARPNRPTSCNLPGIRQNTQRQRPPSRQCHI